MPRGPSIDHSIRADEYRSRDGEVQRGINYWMLTREGARPTVERVGQFHQNVKLIGDKAVTVRMLVDTGATYSMISESLARAIGIKLHSRPYTANAR